jgi:hypothetical protein
MQCLSYLKPFLTLEHMSQRVFYAASKYKNGNKFDGIHQSIHVDKKWFFLMEAQLQRNIAIDKEAPNWYTKQGPHHKGRVSLCNCKALVQQQW